MCYPKPGPRCSGHTRQELEKAKQQIDDAKQRLEYVHTNPSSAEEREEIVREISRLREQYEEKYNRWLETPDGIAHLRTQSEESDGAERAYYQRLYEQATLRREESIKAYQQLQEASTRVDGATPEQQERLEELWANHTKAYHEYLSVKTQVEHSDKEVKAIEDSAHLQQAESKALLQEAKNEQSKLARTIRDTYVAHGVPKDLANHYARDSLDSLQSGHTYSIASNERFPILKEGNTNDSTITFKTKSGIEATHNAANELNASPEVTEAMHNIYLKNQIYNSSLDTLKSTERELVNQRQVNAELHANLKQETANARQTRHEYNKYYGAISSGLIREKDIYHVDTQQFFKSAYLSPEGESNAYILSNPRLGDSTVPVYTQVVRFWRDGKGTPCIETSMGDKYRGRELEGCSLVLKRPQEGWKRVFG